MAAVSSIGLADIDALLQEYTSEEVRCSVNELAPAWAKVKSFKTHGGIGAVDLAISTPAYQMDDGGAYVTSVPQYASMGRLTYQGRPFAIPLKIPYGAAKLADGKEASVNMVSTQLKRAAEAGARAVGRAFLVSDASTVLYTLDDGDDNAVSLAVTDPTGWRAGQLYDVMDVSATPDAVLTRIQVTSVAYNGTNYTVTFANAVSGSGVTGVGTVSTGDYIIPSNTFGLTAMTSLTDVCGTGSVYGQAQTILEWSATKETASTQASAANLSLLAVKIQQKRGLLPDMTILSPVRWQTLYNSQVSKIQYQGSTVDDFGKKPEFFGSEVVSDPNCPVASVFLINTRDIMKDIFSDWEAIMDGGGSGGVGAKALHADPDYLAYFARVVGIFNTRCELRNGCGMLSAATA